MSYDYVEASRTPTGQEIPKIPVLWLRIRSKHKSAITPAIIDTGFDGGIYSDDRLPLVFEGESSIGMETLYSLGHSVVCQVFEAETSLIEERSRKEALKIGNVHVYIPMRINDLAESIIVGRGVLNTMDLLLSHVKKVVITQAKG